MKHGKKSIGWLITFLLIFNVSCATDRTVVKPSKPEAVNDKFLTKLTPEQKKDGLKLLIGGSGSLQYTIFKLENPKRLVLDLPDTDSTAFSAPIDIGKGVASKIQAQYFPQTGNSRIEILLNEPVLYKVARQKDNQLLLTMDSYIKTVQKSRTLKPGETEITGFELREMSGLGRIIISYNGSKPEFLMTRKQEKKRVVLDILNSKVMRENEKLLTVTVKDTIVKRVALFQYSTKPKGIVKVVANLSEFTSSNAFEKDGKLILDIGSQAILANASELKDEKVEDKPVDISSVEEKQPEDYEGKRISLDFQGASIQNILRIIADVSKMNIITSDKVSGKVSMKLNNVPWDLALDIILKNNKLGMVRTGNIIRVATLEELETENQSIAKSATAGSLAEPLYLKVFQVNYESVAKLKSNLDAIKSERGSVDINERTSALIIQETAGKLSEMERLIEILDRQTPQVLIEARIVEVSNNFARELGIKWGGSYARNTGAAFPATIGLSGLTSAGAASSAAGGIVNLGTSGSPTGALGLRLGHVNGTAMLDMQLLALQTEGKGRILSMPKIATMDNTEALIESGREIPYQTVSADGTKTEFKRAVLALKVTPHIAKDEFIRLEIEANKDEPDWARQLPGSPPPLLTKKAKTEVLVKDGDTTVLGGLFKENKTTSRASVPFFSKIPIVGNLFKSKAQNDEGEELLIFITPKTF